MKKAILILTLLSICVVAGNASQADDKVYPGLNCVELNDTTPEITYQYAGHAYNASSGTNVYACPVVTEDLSSSQVSSWNVTAYREPSSTAAWDIVLWNTQRSGWNGYGVSVTVPSATGTYHTISGPAIPSQGANRVMWIETIMPAYGHLVSYMVNEI